MSLGSLEGRRSWWCPEADRRFIDSRSEWEGCWILFRSCPRMVGQGKMREDYDERIILSESSSRILVSPALRALNSGERKRTRLLQDFLLSFCNSCRVLQAPFTASAGILMLGGVLPQ